MKKFVLFLLVLLVSVSAVFADSLMKVLCIPLYDKGEVEFRNSDDLSLVKTLSGFSLPNSATLSSDGKYYYVSNRGNYTISVISTDNYNTVGTIQMPSYCDIYGVLFDASNNTLYVGSSKGIYIIELNDNLKEAKPNSFTKIFDNKQFFNCAIVGSKLYAVDYSGSNLFVYDLKTKTDPKIIDLSKINSGLNSLYLVNASPDGRWLLVTTTFSNAKTGLIDLTTIDNPTPTVKIFPRDVLYGDFSKDSKYVYYTSIGGDGYLYKCSIDNLSSETKVNLDAKYLYSLGITEDEHYAYALSYDSSKLLKVDLTKMSLEKTESVSQPYIAGGFMPTTSSFMQYEEVNLKPIDVNFNYNSFGGTDFSIKAIQGYSAYNAAVTSPTNYTSWTDAAKTQVADWEIKVVEPMSAKAKFLGWYTDSTFKTPANFETPLTDSVTFYAKWKEYLHDWKYYTEGNKLYAYCDNAYDECKYFGVEKAIALDLLTNIGKVEFRIEPSNATNKQVIIESSEPQVAILDEAGYVKPLSEGTTTITLTANDESVISNRFTVVVVEKAQQ